MKPLLAVGMNRSLPLKGGPPGRYTDYITQSQQRKGERDPAGKTRCCLAHLSIGIYPVIFYCNDLHFHTSAL